MYSITQTPEFSAWIKGLKDSTTRAKLLIRLRKVMNGNLGDAKPVGSGVYEMREDFGPGWRMYYMKQGSTVILMLGGGNKSTQQRDIQKAIALSKTQE